MIDITTFWKHYAHQPYELIQGEVLPLPDKGYVHEIVTSRALMCLSVHVEEHYLGEVFGGGVRFALSQIDLRAIDVAFVPQDRLSQLSPPQEYIPHPPDLLLEVLSARYTSTQIEQKAHDFLGAGTAIVWLIDPDTRSITALAANGDRATLRDEDNLGDFANIPKLHLRADDVFPPLKTHLNFY